MKDSIFFQMRSVTKRFGGLTAVKDFSLALKMGELRGIIGPNGAGKTTVFNMMSGIYTPDEGDILLEGQSLKGLRPDEMNQRGIGRTFQNIRLFNQLTVLENLLIGAHRHSSYSLLSLIFNSSTFQKEEEEMIQEAKNLLSFFHLEKKESMLAKNLPYGDQRLLEIARCLMTKPVLLLLDEPAAGMNPRETKDLTDLLRQVRDKFSVTLVLIEHDMKLVMNLCEKISVLDYGILVADGDPGDIQKNPKVLEAYLGGI